MRKFFVVLIVTLFFNGTPALLAQESQVLDQVVAVVDNEIILLSELRQQALTFAIQYGINPQTQQQKFNELMSQVLENLVIQKVLYVKALEDTLTVEDRIVNEELERNIERLVQQFGSREKVKEYYGTSIEKIKRNFSEDTRQGLMAKMVMGQKEATIKITRREVEAFYKTMKDSLPDLPESYHIANLLLKIQAGEISKARARERMEKIEEELKAGGDFKELAEKYSDDKASAANGGDLGFFQRGELVREFEEVAYLLKPDEISGIVGTSFGFHIIQMIERQGEKINCRHILAALEPTIDDEKQVVTKIQEIHQKLKSGAATFEEMVDQYSEDITSKEAHGDLGWWEKDMLQLKEFKWALEDLKPGEVSEPVKTQLGYHIIKLFEKQDSRPLDVKSDWDRIEAFALQMKKQDELKKWVDKLKENIYINIKDVALE
jgi:peptidyl-prolyl cis-trans isomerase SurA